MIMRKSFLFLLLLCGALCANGQTGSAIFAVGTEGTITTNSSFINPFYNYPGAPSLTYSPQNPVNVQVGTKTYVVKTCIFNNWDNDADTGFHIIEVSSGGQVVLTFKSALQWAYLSYPAGSGMYRNFKSYSDNNYFIKVPLSDSSVAIIFVGWPYDSTPSMLTIVVLTQTDAKLVYNKNMEINTITLGSAFSMILQSNTVEYNAQNVPFNGETPKLHTIWLEDGVLRFKDN